MKTPPMASRFAGVDRTFQIPQPLDQLTIFANLLIAGLFGAREGEVEVADRCAEIPIDTGLIDKANATAGRCSEPLGIYGGLNSRV